MPAYDYKCKSCENIFEQFRSISKRNDPSECPKCGSTEVEMAFGTCSLNIGDPVHLGVYKTDSGWKELLTRMQKKHPKGDIKIR